ncbi:MAG: hypothetical protein AB1652_01925 [Bacillota bacterium]
MKRCSPLQFFPRAHGKLLAAREFGVDSIPAVNLVAYPDLIRAELEIPENLMSVFQTKGARSNRGKASYAGGLASGGKDGHILFLPFSIEIRRANYQPGLPAREWVYGRIEGEE